jgi:hypothetical protein
MLSQSIILPLNCSHPLFAPFWHSKSCHYLHRTAFFSSVDSKVWLDRTLSSFSVCQWNLGFSSLNSRSISYVLDFLFFALVAWAFNHDDKLLRSVQFYLFHRGGVLLLFFLGEDSFSSFHRVQPSARVEIQILDCSLRPLTIEQGGPLALKVPPEDVLTK